MYTYQWYQWMTFFYIYCFIGWCFESTYVSIRKKKLINRGFLRLPMLPIYGSGAMILLFVSIPVKDNYILMFLFGMIAATVLEYITGAVMEALFKVRYWDYSNQKFNLNGYICLSSSITWGFFAIILTKFVHYPIESAVLSLNTTASLVIVIVISCIFLTDVIISVRTAWDMRRLLEKMTVIKKELVELETKLREIGAEGVMRITELKDEGLEKLEGFKEGSKERFDEFKDRLKELSSSGDEIKDNMGRRMDELKREYKAAVGRMNFFKSAMLRGNPTASSKRFRESLDELKKKLKRDKCDEE